MATDINSIVITGRIGSKPELKTSASGSDYCEISVAVNHYDRSQKKEATDWFRAVVFGHDAVYLSKYSDKGNNITVRGSMQSNKGNDGKTYWKIVSDSVVLVRGGAAPAPAPAEISGELVDMPDEDIPF